MKKRINIARSALGYLHQVLSETGVVSKVDARKQHTTFQCMEKEVNVFRDRYNDLKKEYRIEEEVPDGRGGTVKRFVIPEAKRPEYDDKLVALENEMVDVDFDKESFNVLNVAFDEMFTKQAAAKERGESEGFKNETIMKLINEAARALEEAKDI